MVTHLIFPFTALHRPKMLRARGARSHAQNCSHQSATCKQRQNGGNEHSLQQAAAFALGQQAKRMNAPKRAHTRNRKRRSREKGQPTPLHGDVVQGCLDDVVSCGPASVP